MGTATKAHAEPHDSYQLLNIDDVVKLLKVSRTTAFSLAQRKQNPIPSVKIGKSRRFPLNKVLAWMEKLEQ